jgi:flavin-dependent dehydrogenase
VSTKSGEDGAFSIGSLPPLDYRVQIKGLPSGAYVIHAREGDRDILADGTRISADSNIDILIGANGGVIEGVVRDSRGQIVQGAVVVLAPDAALRNREDLYRRADTDQHGNFTLRGLPPGAFTLFAWMNVEGAAFLKSDFMKDFEERGKAVRVVRGQTMKIEVPLADEGK